jgi:phosphoglycolate phosphatase
MLRPVNKAVVVWDWNGTLLNDVEVCVASMNRLLARRNLGQLTVPAYRAVFTFPVQTYYERMGFDFERESFADVAIEYHEAYEALVPDAELHRDAVAVLEELRRGGFEQVVLSALEESRLHSELRGRGIDGYFSHVYGLSDLHARSKAQRGKELMAALAGAAPCAWMIGDTVHDAEVAAEMGIESVLVECGHHSREQLQATGSPVFPSVRDAAGFIRNDVGKEVRCEG